MIGGIVVIYWVGVEGVDYRVGLSGDLFGIGDGFV